MKAKWLVCGFAIISSLAALGVAGRTLGAQSGSPVISKAAADSCAAKIAKLESFADAPKPGSHPMTQISETEMNSYLALVLKPNYHPSLNSLTLKFEEGSLQGVARIDFDKLEFKSTQFLSGLIRAMLSGVHVLTVKGKLAAQAGKANFELEEARFDTVTLPNFLVSEIITTVGKRQNPPFDPMTPTTMPYKIQKVEPHPGRIDIWQ